MDVAETQAAAQDGQRGDGEGVREREREERGKYSRRRPRDFSFPHAQVFFLLFLGDDNFFWHKERTTLLTI